MFVLTCFYLWKLLNILYRPSGSGCYFLNPSPAKLFQWFFPRFLKEDAYLVTLLRGGRGCYLWIWGVHFSLPGLWNSLAGVKRASEEQMGLTLHVKFSRVLWNLTVEGEDSHLVMPLQRPQRICMGDSTHRKAGVLLPSCVAQLVFQVKAWLFCFVLS